MNQDDQEKINAIKARARREKLVKNSGSSEEIGKRKKSRPEISGLFVFLAEVRRNYKTSRLVINGLFVLLAVWIVFVHVLDEGKRGTSIIPAFIFFGWLVVWYNVSAWLSDRTALSISSIGGGFLVGTAFYVVAVISYDSAQEAKALEAARGAGFSTIDAHEKAKQRGFITKSGLVQFERKKAITMKKVAQELALTKKREKEEAARRTKAQKVRRDAKCKRDLSCWAQKYVYTASHYCSKDIEDAAKYDFQWTGGDGIFNSKFTHFRWKDRSDLTVTYLGDKLKLQNGFGAWQYHKYECDYDPQAKSILAVRVNPGRLTN